MLIFSSIPDSILNSTATEFQQFFGCLVYHNPCTLCHKDQDIFEPHLQGRYLFTAHDIVKKSTDCRAV